MKDLKPGNNSSPGEAIVELAYTANTLSNYKAWLHLTTAQRLSVKSVINSLTRGSWEPAFSTPWEFKDLLSEVGLGGHRLVLGALEMLRDTAHNYHLAAQKASQSSDVVKYYLMLINNGLNIQGRMVAAHELEAHAHELYRRSTVAEKIAALEYYLAKTWKEFDGWLTKGQLDELSTWHTGQLPPDLFAVRHLKERLAEQNKQLEDLPAYTCTWPFWDAWKVLAYELNALTHTPVYAPIGKVRAPRKAPKKNSETASKVALSFSPNEPEPGKILSFSSSALGRAMLNYEDALEDGQKTLASRHVVEYMKRNGLYFLSGRKPNVSTLQQAIGRDITKSIKAGRERRGLVDATAFLATLLEKYPYPWKTR